MKLFCYLTALLRLYHLPFINIISGEKGWGRYYSNIVTHFKIHFRLEWGKFNFCMKLLWDNCFQSLTSPFVGKSLLATFCVVTYLKTSDPKMNAWLIHRSWKMMVFNHFWGNIFIIYIYHRQPIQYFLPFFPPSSIWFSVLTTLLQVVRVCYVFNWGGRRYQSWDVDNVLHVALEVVFRGLSIPTRKWSDFSPL